jgi:hypothetical protein
METRQGKREDTPTDTMATDKTLTIRVPILITHEVEMDYDRFCDYVSPLSDEDSPTHDKRCREMWDAMLEVHEDGRIELEQIDDGDYDGYGDVLDDYRGANDEVKTIIEDILDTREERRELMEKRRIAMEKRKAEQEAKRKADELILVQAELKMLTEKLARLSA